MSHLTDLIKRLREGCALRPRRWSGDTHDDLGGSVDEPATDAVMAEAADEIERLAELLREAGAELEWLLDARNNSGSEGPPRVWRLVATIRAALNQTPNTEAKPAREAASA